MSHLLKPNDSGLASLDDVRAWMEAQQDNTVHAEKMKDKENAGERNDFDKRWIERLERTQFMTYWGTRTCEEWDAICKGGNQTPITLPEIYHLTKYRNATESLTQKFKIMDETLHYDDCNTLTGTTYDESFKTLGDRISKTVIELPEGGLCFRQGREDILTVERFLKTMFSTYDDSSTIKRTLGTIVGNAKKLHLFDFREPGANPEVTYSPVILFSSNETPHIYKATRRERRYSCITVKL